MVVGLKRKRQSSVITVSVCTVSLLDPRLSNFWLEVRFDGPATAGLPESRPAVLQFLGPFALGLVVLQFRQYFEQLVFVGLNFARRETLVTVGVNSLSLKQILLNLAPNSSLRVLRLRKIIALAA
jgi:hypothetical protein